MKLIRYIIILILSAGLAAASLQAQNRQQDLTSLEGTWVTYAWNGESAPVRYELEVRRDALRVDVTLRRPGQTARSFEGYLNQGVGALHAGGFRMEPIDAGRSIVELNDPDFGPRELELVFWKEQI